MSNKSGSDTGDVAKLLASADRALEQAYYASVGTLAVDIASVRAALARVKLD